MSQLPSHILVKVRHALAKDDDEISGFIRRILGSKTKITDVLDLDGHDAKQFINLLKIVCIRCFSHCCGLMVNSR
jgi:hypothetical protein